MSLGGIAIAIGAMVDAAVVMIENAHKHIEVWHRGHPTEDLAGAERWRVVGDAAAQVGPALFTSLLIITLSFIPVFTLEAQEGRLFSPLAYTKTYAMAAAAGLAVTFDPGAHGLSDSRPDSPRAHNPLNRALLALYRPLLHRVLAFPRVTLAIALLSSRPLPIRCSHWRRVHAPLDEATCCTCPRRSPAFRPVRWGNCCSRRTG